MSLTDWFFASLKECLLSRYKFSITLNIFGKTTLHENMNRPSQIHQIGFSISNALMTCILFFKPLAFIKKKSRDVYKSALNTF